MATMSGVRFMVRLGKKRLESGVANDAGWHGVLTRVRPFSSDAPAHGNVISSHSEVKRARQTRTGNEDTSCFVFGTRNEACYGFLRE